MALSEHSETWLDGYRHGVSDARLFPEFGPERLFSRARSVREIYDDLPEKVDYKTYLASPEWQEFRRRTILAAGKKCVRCGVLECLTEESALDVHHKHYRTLGAELREDVEVLCRKCHKRADRERVALKQQKSREKAFNTWHDKVYGELVEVEEFHRDDFEDWMERQ